MKKHKGFIPTDFITMTLFQYNGTPNEETVSRLRTDLGDRFYEEVINRLDYFLYGRNHRRMNDRDKFSFIYREETKSRQNTLTLPHIHILLSLEREEAKKMDDQRWKLEQSLEQLCSNNGFQEDVDIQKHDFSLNDYIFKFPLEDILWIYSRNAG